MANTMAVSDTDAQRWHALWQAVRSRRWDGRTIAGAFCQYLTPGMVHVYIVFTSGDHTIQAFTLAAEQPNETPGDRE